MSKGFSQKIPVLIASSLKPAKDARAFWRLGQTLRETNKYDLNFIGFSSKAASSPQNDRFFISITNTKSQLERIVSIFRFFNYCLIVKPKILICCTWEYLIPAKILKSYLGFRIIYDVQENYLANLNLILNRSTWKVKLAKWLIEKSECIKGIDYYILAEKCYQDEMPSKKPFIILENKYNGPKYDPKPPVVFKEKEAFEFLLTGTITPAYGMEKGIQFFLQILERFPKSKLRVFGHVTLEYFGKNLLDQYKNHPRIFIELSSDPIPYTEVLDAIYKTDFLLLPYLNHKALAQKIPSKLFEAGALNTAVIIQENPTWTDFVSSHKMGVSVDFQNTQEAVKEFISGLDQDFFQGQIPEVFHWKAEGEKLLSVLDSLSS
ncbi:glycosyltransferase family protein [Algoriphagus formosus]|uniref:glycosyltransferase n=1 Tax=Algoriphagus formosus TaxID=2007308 RepID=UPI000C28E740|nr:glycosyltransferase [Algoriphagus formosus]